MLGDTASAASGQILLLDPDADVREGVGDLLARHGFIVHAAVDMPSAELILERQPIDIAILGARRPDAEGLAFCRRIAETLRARVIILSGAASEVDRVLGLEFGADDFLAKPFSPRELLARVRALRRRQGRGAAPAAAAPVYVFDSLVFDTGRRELRAAAGGRALVLQAGVTELLHAFLQQPRRILSRQALVTAAGLDPDIDTRAIDMRVSRVRQTLRALSERDMIRTVRGAGYVLDTDVTVRRGVEPPL
jgi:two-component system OmpR family response regulator